ARPGEFTILPPTSSSRAMANVGNCVPTAFRQMSPLRIRFRRRLAGTRTHAISWMVAKVRLCGRAANGESLRIVRFTRRNVANGTLILWFGRRHTSHPQAKASGEDSKGEDDGAERPPRKLNMVWRWN